MFATADSDPFQIAYLSVPIVYEIVYMLNVLALFIL